MMQTRWDATQVPNQQGRVALVTGANSGLGWQLALNLARHGAHVVMACRDATRASHAMQTILAQVPSASLSHVRLDLSDLASVRRCAAEVLTRHERLDLLCNNAGVMFLPFRRSVDGHEIQMASNHLGHFLLTGLLLPRLNETPGARVVTMSSGFNRFGRLPQHGLAGSPTDSPYASYCHSKLANLVFARELHKRLSQARSGTLSVAAHPGYAATNLQYGAADATASKAMASAKRWVMRLSNAALAQPASMGALPALYAATAAQVRGGDYIGPHALMESRGYPAHARVPRRAMDAAAAARFWALSERSVQFTY